MACGMEGGDAVPHRLVRGEDIFPRGEKCFLAPGEPQGFGGPGVVVIGVDPTRFKFVFAFDQGVESVADVFRALRNQAHQRRDEINANDDVANIE